MTADTARPPNEPLDWPGLLEELRRHRDLVALGGGPQAVERQHAKGRMTARERVAALIDPGNCFLELGRFAAWNMYAEWGGAPAASVICGVARVSGRSCMLIANDATVKAGAFFPTGELVKAARDEQVDLIVIGTHGRGAVAHLLLGSVAEKVVRSAPCPVLTVRSGEREFVVP